jgi:allantoin racemase
LYKIKVILPVATDAYVDALSREMQGFALDPRFEYDIERLTHGSVSVECEYDCAMASPYVIEVAERAERDGFHAVVVYCAVDPAVKACKEALSIPVVGVGEAGGLYGVLLGRRFSVLTVLDNTVAVTREVIEDAVGSDFLVSIRSVDIPVADLSYSAEDLFQALLKCAREAVAEDCAEALVLGCTCMVGVAERLHAEVSKQTGAFIPVISPGAASLHLAQSLVLLNYRQSGLRFMPPPRKMRM